MSDQPGVAVVCLTPRGGHIEHAYNLAAAISARSGVLTLLVSKAGSAAYLPASTPGVRVVELPMEPKESPGVLAKALKNVTDTAAVRTVLKRFPSLRLVVIEEPQMAFAPSFARRVHVAAVVHNAREHDAARPGPATLLREGLKLVTLLRAERVLVHGQEQFDGLPKPFRRKVRIGELPGVGAFELAEPDSAGTGGPDATDVLLCIGEIRENKHYEEAIEASARSGAKLVIAGEATDPEYLRKLEELVARSHAPVEIQVGFLDSGTFGRLLRTCRGVVLPYEFFHAQSGVLERGAAEGAPVLVSDLPSLREQAEGRDGVHLYPSGDVDALSRLMIGLPSRTGSGTATSVAAERTVDPRWADLAEAVTPTSVAVAP